MNDQIFGKRNKHFDQMEMESCERGPNGGCRLSRFGICALTLFALCGMVVAGLLGSRLGVGTGNAIGSSGSSSSGPCFDSSETSSDANESTVIGKKMAIRLPEWPKPIHYALNIRPDLLPNHLSYDGNVSILLASGADQFSVDRLLLHSLQLNVTQVTVWKVPSSSIAWFEASSSVPSSNAQSSVFLQQLPVVEPLKVRRFDLDSQNETLRVTLNSPLAPNSAYRLDIEFKGSISNLLSGFYRSTYIDTAGKTRYDFN
jgi:hypothetical protein